MPELTTMPRAAAITGGELIPGLQAGAAVGMLAAQVAQAPRGPILFARAPYEADATSTSAGDPGSGKLRWDSSSPDSAGALYVSDVDGDLEDHATAWAQAGPGSRLYVQRVDAGGIVAQQVWQVAGLDQESGYASLAVSLLASHGDFSDADVLQISLQAASAGAADAEDVAYDSTASGLSAGNVQQAIDLLAAADPGAGDVGGPASSVDNTLPRFSGTSGKQLQGSGVALTDDDEISGYRGLINRQTGTSYTLQASDTGKILEFANSAAITVTCPNGLPAGFCCTLVQDADGQVQLLAGLGAALKNRQSHTKLAGNGAFGTVYVSTVFGGSAYRFGGDTVP